MNNNLNGSENDLQANQRVAHSTKRNLLILAAGIVVIILCWPILYDFVLNQIASEEQVAKIKSPDMNEDGLPAPDRPASFNELLDTAIKYDKEGKRELADKLFRKLIRLVLRRPTYTTQMAKLFPLAADFYSKGDEIPVEQVEYLYLDALDVLRYVYGSNYHAFENVYQGLEKHYLSLKRYEDAAIQTRALLKFYHRYYRNDKETQYEFMQPTAIRLGHNLLAAGQNTEAREAYQTALEMTKSRGGSVKAIEEFIEKTY